jgi:hypothetical protein
LKISLASVLETSSEEGVLGPERRFLLMLSDNSFKKELLLILGLNYRWSLTEMREMSSHRSFGKLH